MRVRHGWSLLLGGSLFLAIQAVSFGQKAKTAHQVLTEAEGAILDHRYAQAIRILKKSLKEFPSDNRLQAELGRAYLLKGNDGKASGIFRKVLQRDPENRQAKVGLAGALSRRGNYKSSDRLYGELLRKDPRDETAAIGLASNLMNERRGAEARKVVKEGLAFHPDSLVLQEFLDRLNEGGMGGNEPYAPQWRNHAGGSAGEVSDSAGDLSWWLAQGFDWRVAHAVSNHFQMEERWLSSTGTPLLRTTRGTDEFRLRLFNPVTLNLEGGGVKFPDGATRTLYRAGLEILPVRQLWLETDFSRRPFYPDAVAAKHDLTVEGWRTRFRWKPGQWTMDGRWSRRHYSDGNLAKKGHLDLMHWTQGQLLALGTGYRFTQYNFRADLDDGYFDPNKYQSHLAEMGVKINSRKGFHAKYLVRAGGESTKRGGPFDFGWEVSARNRVNWGRWELNGDFIYFRLVQNTGAFQAQEVRFGITYHF